MSSVFNISILHELFIKIYNFYNLIVEHLELLFIFEGMLIGAIILLSSSLDKKILESAIKTVQVGVGVTVIATGINTGLGTKLTGNKDESKSNNTNNTDGKNSSSSNNNDNKSNK
jgi:uncharacterized membrane protein YczE